MKRSWYPVCAGRAAATRCSSRDERGMILPLTFIILIVLTSLVFGLLAMGGSESRITAGLLRTTQALDLAEAGAERAIAQFIADPTLVNTACNPVCPPVLPRPQPLFGGQAQTLGNLGTYTVTYQPIASATVLIESTGQTQIDGAQQVLQVIVTTQWNPAYALLGGEVRSFGEVRGRLGAVHGNIETRLDSTTSRVEQTATSSGNRCDSCTDPHLVGNPAGSGPNRPQVDIPALDPSSFLSKADFVLGDDTTAVNYPDGTSITVPGHQILIVATRTLVAENSGIFHGFSRMQGNGEWVFQGGQTPPNGTYFASKRIRIIGNPGSQNNPWKATLVAGNNREEGEVEIEGNVNMVPALLDLLAVAGQVEARTSGVGHATLAGVISASRTLGATPPRIGEAELRDGVNLTGNVIGAHKIELEAGARVFYDRAMRTGLGGGSLQILSWSPR